LPELTFIVTTRSPSLDEVEHLPVEVDLQPGRRPTAQARLGQRRREGRGGLRPEDAVDLDAVDRLERHQRRGGLLALLAVRGPTR
jgi:hypothetical protein